MKKLLILFVVINAFSSFGQEDSGLPKEKLYEAKKQLRDGNKLYEKEKFEDAAIAYQKSLAEDGTYYKGAYNLGNTFFKQKKYKEAGEQFQLANKLAKTKENKAKTSELLGDTFKKQNELEKAIEAYKQALLKNPSDDILREKFVAAKKEKQKQDQQNKDNKDNKDQNKDNKNDKDKGDNKDNKNKDNKGDNDKKDDKGGDKDNKDDKKDGDDNKQDKGNQGDDENKEQPKPKESKLSPEQIEQLLESMNNEEQKTQKKVNAQKVKVKENNNEKDW